MTIYLGFLVVLALLSGKHWARAALEVPQDGLIHQVGSAREDSPHLTCTSRPRRHIHDAHKGKYIRLLLGGGGVCRGHAVAVLCGCVDKWQRALTIRALIG
jgi:hypothetical protein